MFNAVRRGITRLDVTRRQFLAGLGIVAGAAGVSAAGCDRLIPYINQPEEIIPGVSTWYATSCRECPAGCGMLIRNCNSRTVKCEGNPVHPVSNGALCARGQAAVQGLYDPDRPCGPLNLSNSGDFKVSRWSEALSSSGRALANSKSIALISDLQSGSLESLMRKWLAAFGSNRLLVYEPIDYEPVRSTNAGVVPTYDIAQSDYLIAFGCDFLETWVSPVEYAHAFTEMRRITNGNRAKFVYLGPRVSATASCADARVLVPPGSMETIARTLLGGDVGTVASMFGLDVRLLKELRCDLSVAKAPLAMPGWDADSANAAALINSRLGTRLVNRGRAHAVTHIAPYSDIIALIEDMEKGRIDALVVYGANPVYSLPDSERFAEAMKRVKTIVSLSSWMDETAAVSHWVLPSCTPLETWGDYQPYSDVKNLIQPTMGLISDCMQTGDILMRLAGEAGFDVRRVFGAQDYHRYLCAEWGCSQANEDTGKWEDLLQRGGLWPGSANEESPVSGSGYTDLRQAWGILGPAGQRNSALSQTSGEEGSRKASRISIGKRSKISPGQISLYAFPHIYYYDGRTANRRWLQEMPEPVTNAVWGSWAEMHPDTAKRVGVRTDDVVIVERNGRRIEVSVYVWEGTVPGVVAIPMGEGHKYYGRYARNIGVNVFPLLGPGVTAVNVTPTGSIKWITRIRGSTDQRGRNIVQTASLEKAQNRTVPVTMPLPSGYTKLDFYPGHKYREHRWAMVVDMSKCIGCHACATACYAENNLGTVGPDGIWRRREMSWLRIDRYIDWSMTSTPLVFQPMLCQQCDSAPCEAVCPVYASSHSDEGLNMQVYNRCVGTRYCSNNCPYKVRRFNWFDYDWPEPLNWQLNPDVTVRCRGVMEKCTFCVQRIREAETNAQREERIVRDGEITPACAQTCPTGVFTFGDLLDPKSKVSLIYKEEPRAYQVLSELNTKPAVLYLKRIVDDE